MSTLAKLLDCLKWPKARAAGQPIGPRGEIAPVADPELAFGWQGYLFNQNLQVGVIGANTIGASVTIPDDCFYLIDAAGIVSDVTFVLVGGALTTRRCALEIVDVQGVVAWQLARTWTGGSVTAVGMQSQTDGGDIQLKVHLLQNMIVRWKLLDATTTASGIYSTSVTLRKLYEETL